jgi:hypothetical protein
MRASNQLFEVGTHDFGRGITLKMKYSLAVTALLMSISVSGMAQQNNQFKVKPSVPERTKKSTPLPVGKATGGTTAAGSNAKDLQAVEHQTARTSGAHAGGKKTAPAIRPVKDRSDSNPPINFNSGGSKSPGLINKGSNPYKGRLRQKGKQGQ